MAGKTCPNSYSDDFTYLAVNIDDIGEEDISAHFSETRQFIGWCHVYSPFYCHVMPGCVYLRNYFFNSHILYEFNL
jgi:hypothetical protein